jgi:predicted oxidoreductase
MDEMEERVDEYIPNIANYIKKIIWNKTSVMTKPEEMWFDKNGRALRKPMGTNYKTERAKLMKLLDSYPWIKFEEI